MSQLFFFSIFAKNVPAPFFSFIPQIMLWFCKNFPAPFFLNYTSDNVHGSRLDVLSLEKLDLARNWVSLVVKFDQQGCHHKWNRWISSISWPAQEIESRESTVGSSVGWRCKAGTEARWPRHLDWQNFVQYLLIAISNWIFQFEKMEALWPCLTSSASQWMLRGWW